MVGFNFKFMLFAVMIIFSGYVFSYSDLGGGICECNSCADCTSAINSAACTDIRLTTNIINQVGNCIDNPANFSGKTFDCQGNLIDGDDAGTDDGIYLNSKNGNKIENCIIRDFTRGIYILSSLNANLSGNNATSNTNYGIHLQSSSNSTLTNNNASSNVYYGIYLQSSLNNTLTNNTANSNTDSNAFGIYVGGASNNNTLIDNTANSNAYGIVLASSLGNTLNNNTINSNTNSGIFLQVSSDFNILSNNTARSNSNGIYIQTSSNNSVIKNSLISNSYGFFVGSTSGSNTFTNNNASSNSVGIYLFSSSSWNNLTNNTANSNTNHGIYLQSSANNNNLFNNTANSNTNHGIYLQSSSTKNNLTGNTVNSNTQRGICLESSSNNTIVNNTANSNSVNGIHLEGSHNNQILDNLAGYNGYHGFYLHATSLNNTLTRNTANSNVIYGFYLGIHCENNTLINNTANLNRLGIILYNYANNNNLSNNTANYNGYYGIQIQLGSGNLVNNSVFNFNNKTGLDVLQSPNNTFINITLFNNTWAGLNVTYEDGNNFTDVTASYGMLGINVESSARFNHITLISNDAFIRSSGSISANFTDIVLRDESDGTNITYPSVLVTGSNLLNSARVNIGSDFVSLNTTTSDVFNATANISFAVSDCNVSYSIYKKIGFPSSANDIIENGTVYSPSYSLCSNNIYTFTVNSFSGYALEESASPEPEQSSNNDENTNPSISFISSTSEIVSQSFIDAVVEAEDENDNLDSIEIFLFKDSELQDSKTCSASPCSANFSSLDEGIYKLNATAIDSKDAVDSTETRTIILDTTSPKIEFISPTPAENAVLDNNAITVSTSASDSNYERTTIQLFKGTEKLDEFSCSNAICTTSYELENGNYSMVATSYDKAGNKNEIYREFEVFVFIEEELPVLEEQPSKEESPVVEPETEEKQQDNEQNGKDKGSSSSSSASGSNNNGPETEVTSTSETNPVSSVIAFVVNNPIVVTVPTAGAVGILLLHRAKII